MSTDFFGTQATIKFSYRKLRTFEIMVVETVLSLITIFMLLSPLTEAVAGISAGVQVV